MPPEQATTTARRRAYSGPSRIPTRASAARDLAQGSAASRHSSGGTSRTPSTSSSKVALRSLHSSFNDLQIDEANERARRFFEAEPSFSLQTYLKTGSLAPTTRPSPEREPQPKAPTPLRSSSPSSPPPLAISSAPSAPTYPSAFASSSSRTLSTPVKAASSSSVDNRSRSDEAELTKSWFRTNRADVEPGELLALLGERDVAAAIAQARTALKAMPLLQRQSFYAGFLTEAKGAKAERGWIEGLCEVLPTKPSAPNLVYHSYADTPIRGSPIFAQARKLDGILTLKNKLPVLRDGITVFEYTKSTTTRILKLDQLVFNCSDILTEQVGRYYMPGLLMTAEEALLVVVTRDSLLVAVIKECWTRNLPTLVVVIRTLFTLNVYTAGFLPHLQFEDKDGIQPLHLNDTRLPQLQLVLPPPPSSHSLRLVAGPLPHHSPLSRATCAHFVDPEGGDEDGGDSADEPTTDGERLMKQQWVSDTREAREPGAFEAITSSDLGSDDLQHFPTLLGHLVFDRLPTQLALSTSKSPRHLEILLLRNPFPNARRLVDPLHPPSLPQLLDVFARLPRLLLHLYQRAGVLHRDISPGNVLHAEGVVLVTDLDCAYYPRLAAIEPSNVRTGTQETMARALLDELRAVEHALEHDLESLVYLFWFVLWFFLHRDADRDPTGREAITWNRWLFKSSHTKTAFALLGARNLAWGPAGAANVEMLGTLSPVFGTLAESLMAHDPQKVTDGSMSVEELVESLTQAFEAARAALKASGDEETMGGRWPSTNLA
ncbi:hypothetical protein BCR35DRAFT_152720 [Leucosporidium creatinivorum]|uniref:Fungal-type protein kinase domain-containing protein n=1 Tax=Leucosporidium creatinivorum TaxID=106004 RepID=A0A1Y2EMY0_9BASI|nr:hypothetical protein BCR35DRAFT_152720 [Leucosporidium creatinivorum]